MLITDEKTIGQVCSAFHEKFPFLKIEFYTEEHEVGKPSAATDKLDHNLAVGKARTVHNQGELSIHGNLKVSTLEENFKAQYGLNAQVFRKSGNLWLQTSSTDSWTLHEQNRKGSSSENHFNEKYNQ
ncbi:MAG: hypothetical protein KDC44_04610 [Phaeodactylibacter sp.]|nr:hypothetical protein [Phaeodactylibacter sp.]